MQAAQTFGFVQAIQGKTDTKVLLRLIHEYTRRGEFVHTAHNSPRGAGKLLAEEKTYPKGMKPAPPLHCCVTRSAMDCWCARSTATPTGSRTNGGH